MYVDRRNTGSYRSLDKGASGQDLGSGRSSQRKGHLGWDLEVSKQEYKEGCSQQREQNMQREEREYIQGTENYSLLVEWTTVETVESEACKGDVIEVGLEKHTGLDIKGQGTGRWGDRGWWSGESTDSDPLLLCALQIGTAQGMPERTPAQQPHFTDVEVKNRWGKWISMWVNRGTSWLLVQGSFPHHTQAPTCTSYVLNISIATGGKQLHWQTSQKFLQNEWHQSLS